MLRDALVVDAVVHPYNLSRQNVPESGIEQAELVHRYHVHYTGAEFGPYALRPEEFLTDFDLEAVESALFRESPVDIGIVHALPNLGFLNGVMCSPERAAELRARNPGRFLMYAAVDSPVADEAIAQLERQVAEFAVDGLKIYPAYYYDGRMHGWRLSDTDFATPLLEAAHDLGIRNVAIHKGGAFPPAPPEFFTLEDLQEAPARFPDMNIQIVHAGVAFLDEAAALFARHPNLYATLETTTSFIMIDPRGFAEAFGRLLQAAGPDRLLFASGVNLIHPLPPLQLFAEFEMPDDLVEENGYPEMTDEIRRKVLGENALRLHGLDPVVVRARLAVDGVDSARADGYAPPWSALRAGDVVEVS